MSENLIPFTQRSKEEVREMNAKGGRRSGETRRRKRDMKSKLKMILELPCTDIDSFNNASCMGIDVGDIDNEMIILVALFKKAATGDIPAIKEICNILGIDNAAEELKIKKSELKLKQDNTKKSNGENGSGMLDSLIEGLKKDD